MDRRQLPAQVVRVLQSGVRAEGPCGWELMGRVSEHMHTTEREALNHLWGRGGSAVVSTCMPPRPSERRSITLELMAQLPMDLTSKGTTVTDEAEEPEDEDEEEEEGEDEDEDEEEGEDDEDDDDDEGGVAAWPVGRVPRHAAMPAVHAARSRASASCRPGKKGSCATHSPCEMLCATSTATAPRLKQK